MITIIDYGMGNPASILNMIHRAGGNAVISSDPIEIATATALILPGVGAFDNAIQKLRSTGLIEPLTLQVKTNGIPFIGICLGMQLLFSSSEEGFLPGLGFIDGEVKRFRGEAFDQKITKVPHMGWNIVKPTAGQPMFRDFEPISRFYFAHSYYVECTHLSDIAATCEYGYSFTCAIQHKNIFAVQFHPEKSHKFGLRLFKNFLEQQC